MKAYVLRHGEAAERGDPRYPNDADRPLTTKGTRRSEALAGVLRELDISFDAILASPLVRARETAEIVERGLHLHGRLVLTKHLAPAGDIDQLVRQVNALEPAPDRVLLVGHEPDLSRMISLFCTGGSHVALTLKKGGLCRLHIETLRVGQCATLEWLLSPAVVGKSKRR